jgi:hypothetical protein
MVAVFFGCSCSWRVLGPALSRGPFPRAASQVINYGKKSGPSRVTERAPNPR